jgi:choline dehydrogenase-like flavoprotein
VLHDGDAVEESGWRGGVVDTDLRVYGVRGLSVVGISTWPMSPAGGPQATVYASAEKVSCDCLEWGVRV